MDETKDNSEELIRAHSKETIRLLYGVIEEAPDGIQIADEDGRLLFSNKAVERIFGFSQKELKGRHVDEMNVDQNFASKVILPSIKKSGRWQGELMVKHKEGYVFPIWLTTSTVKDENGHFVALIGIIRDITERKKIEEALLVSEEKFRALAEQSIAGIYLIQDGKLAYVNPRFAEIMGYGQEEMLGLPVLGLAAESDRDRVIKNMNKRLSGEVKDVRYTFNAIKKGGLEVPLEVHGSTMTYLGRPAIIGTVLDITDRKRAEEALRISEEKFKALAEQSITGTCLIQDGKFVYVNPRLAETLDFRQEEMLGMTVLDLVAEPDRGMVLKNMNRRLSGEVSYMRYTFHALKKGGLEVPLEVHGSAMVYLGRPAIMATLLDITDRKRAEEALLKAHNELESQVVKRTAELVEANKLLIQDVAERRQIEKHIRTSNAILKLLSKMPSRKEYLDSIVRLIRRLSGCRSVGIRLLSQNGQIPYESYAGFNRAFWESENWLSVERDQCSCIRVIKGKPLRQDASVMTKGGSFRCDNTIEFLSGLKGSEKSMFRGVCAQNGFVSVAIIPISYRNKIIGAIHLADEKESRVPLKTVKLIESLTPLIGEGTYKFNLTEQVLQKQKELDNSKRLSDIGTLGATVAHELRNPLAAIRMAAYNINRKVRNPEIDKHLANIERKITESNQIINNLLFYSRIRMPNFETVNLHDILNECIGIAKKRSLKEKVSVDQKMGFLKDALIEADPLQMNELFVNIINNSLDSLIGNKGKIEITGKFVGHEFIKIYVKDNGSGIDDGDLKKIFEPFFTTKAKGIGLGLTVCSQIVLLHEGVIDVKSRKGKGTTVVVTLPIRKKIKSHSNKPLI